LICCRRTGIRRGCRLNAIPASFAKPQIRFELGATLPAEVLFDNGRLSLTAPRATPGAEHFMLAQRRATLIARTSHRNLSCFTRHF